MNGEETVSGKARPNAHARTKRNKDSEDSIFYSSVAVKLLFLKTALPSQKKNGTLDSTIKGPPRHNGRPTWFRRAERIHQNNIAVKSRISKSPLRFLSSRIDF